MSALAWRERMRHAPRVTHADGMAVVVLDERVVAFPSEADARFFAEAYVDVPNLAGEVASLRRWIDEGALTAAQERIRVLETERAALHEEIGHLGAELSRVSDVAARAVQRARILATALKRKAP